MKIHAYVDRVMGKLCQKLNIKLPAWTKPVVNIRSLHTKDTEEVLKVVPDAALDGRSAVHVDLTEDYDTEDVKTTTKVEVKTEVKREDFIIKENSNTEKDEQEVVKEENNAEMVDTIEVAKEENSIKQDESEGGTKLIQTNAIGLSTVTKDEAVRASGTCEPNTEQSLIKSSNPTHPNSFTEENDIILDSDNSNSPFPTADCITAESDMDGGVSVPKKVKLS